MREETNISLTKARAEAAPTQGQAPSASALEGPADQAEEEGASGRRRKVDLSQIQPGQKYQGRVTGIAKFGAFVDIGAGRDGLVHISELREGFVDEVDSVVSVGDEVTVWVRSVDQKRKRISLTMMKSHSHHQSLRDLEPGMVLEGTVEGIASFGAFVDIGAPVNGLVHVSEMADSYVRRPQSLVSPGDDVRVRVLEVDRRHRKISLSMKGLHVPRTQARSQRNSGATMTAMQFAWQKALAEEDKDDGS